jgi:hypothetical protein
MMAKSGVQPTRAMIVPVPKNRFQSSLICFLGKSGSRPT